MSYQKVSDGGQTFSHSGTMSIGNPPYTSSDPDFEMRSEIEESQLRLMPMTYVRCPECHHKPLITTNSVPQYYACTKCGWNNTPPHPDPRVRTNPTTQKNTVNTGSNISNNSLLARATRR